MPYYFFFYTSRLSTYCPDGLSRISRRMLTTYSTLRKSATSSDIGQQKVSGVIHSQKVSIRLHHKWFSCYFTCHGIGPVVHVDYSKLTMIDVLVCFELLFTQTYIIEVAWNVMSDVINLKVQVFAHVLILMPDNYKVVFLLWPQYSRNYGKYFKRFYQKPN